MVLTKVDSIPFWYSKKSVKTPESTEKYRGGSYRFHFLDMVGIFLYRLYKFRGLGRRTFLTDFIPGFLYNYNGFYRIYPWPGSLAPGWKAFSDFNKSPVTLFQAGSFL